MPTPAVGTENATQVELYYEHHGTGRPVVLIHGWPLSGRSWENQVPALIDAGYRVVTYDRRGFGKSSQPWTGYDLYLYKCADNPDGGLDDATIAQFEEGVRGDRLEFLDGFTKEFFSSGLGLTGKKVLVSEPQRQYALSIAAGASPKGTLDCIAAFGRTDFRAEVAAISVPTLVIHGDSDQIVPFEVSGKRSADAIEGSELVVVKGGPHGFHASHAAEFNAALLSFLAR